MGVANPGFRPEDKGAPPRCRRPSSSARALTHSSRAAIAREARSPGFTSQLATSWRGINFVRDVHNGRNYEYPMWSIPTTRRPRLCTICARPSTGLTTATQLATLTRPGALPADKIELKGSALKLPGYIAEHWGTGRPAPRKLAIPKLAAAGPLREMSWLEVTGSGDHRVSPRGSDARRGSSCAAGIPRGGTHTAGSRAGRRSVPTPKRSQQVKR